MTTSTIAPIGQCVRNSQITTVDQAVNAADVHNHQNSCLSSPRIKATLLVIASPIVHVIATVVSALLFSMAFFIVISSFKSLDQYKDEFKLMNYTIKQIVAAPFILCALEVAAIYAIFSPNHGLELYTKLEHYQYGKNILASFLK